ncbi:MAG: FkbM family methyltransferase [Chloroflexi bacterium]|jgi:FkbM family methyltransferase|nr:FkbM family methyltransferase [Chloroflexota bacterium]
MRAQLRALHRLVKCRLLGKGVINFRGKGVVNLIDVGSVGSLPYPWNENADKIYHLLKFEPREQSEANPFVTTIDVALWGSNCARDFYVYKGRRGSGSSLFQQNLDYVTQNWAQLRTRGDERLANTWFERSQLDRVERIACRRLDDVLKELGHTFPYHFVKIDAQGAEYEILKGAEHLLTTSCLGLYLELFVIPLYKEIKLFPEVVEYLKGFGFELVKKFSPHGSFDSQHNCLLLKKGTTSQVMDVILKVYDL